MKKTNSKKQSVVKMPLVHSDAALSYEFDPDSSILKQKWLNSGVEYKFYFDDKNRLWQRVVGIYFGNV